MRTRSSSNNLGLLHAIKEIVKKPVVKKTAAKPVKTVSKKAIINKAKPTKAKLVVPKAAVKKATAPKKSKEGESIENMITEREINLKTVEEYLGVKSKRDVRNAPIIPGVFDLIIPPGTPRKLIISLTKKYDLQLVRRDDIYVPVGVCDIERDLLAIRGDEKTIRKMEKILLEEIEAYINSKDALRHNYSKPSRLEGIGVISKTSKAKAR